MQPRSDNVQKVLAEVGPKWIGARNLFSVFDAAPPKLFVQIGSVIGYTGMQGNAWYAFANASVSCELAEFRDRHRDVESICISYSVWDEIGMGKDLGSIDLLARTGIDAIPVAEGVRRFLHVVERDPQCDELVVTARLGAPEPISAWASPVSLRHSGYPGNLGQLLESQFHRESCPLHAGG